MVTRGSGRDTNKTRFALNVPIVLKGKSTFDNDYVLVNKKFHNQVVSEPFLCYESGYLIETKGEVLAEIYSPYFNRTFEHFCSHLTVPYNPECEKYPDAVLCGNLIYLAHNVFTMYSRHGAQVYRDYIRTLLNLIYKKPVLKVDMPSCGRVNFTLQESKNRYVLHVLYYLPLQQGDCSVLENFPELTEVDVKILTDKKIKSVILQPQHISFDFCQNDGEVCFKIPKVKLHQIVTVNY